MPNAVASAALKAFFERYERLEREKAEIAESQKELLAEIKGNGFDLATFREGLKVRREDKAQRAERTALLDLYLKAAE